MLFVRGWGVCVCVSCAGVHGWCAVCMPGLRHTTISGLYHHYSDTALRGMQLYAPARCSSLLDPDETCTCTFSQASRRMATSLQLSQSKSYLNFTKYYWVGVCKVS